MWLNCKEFLQLNFCRNALLTLIDQEFNIFDSLSQTLIFEQKIE